MTTELSAEIAAQAIEIRKLKAQLKTIRAEHKKFRQWINDKKVEAGYLEDTPFDIIWEKALKYVILSKSENKE